MAPEVHARLLEAGWACYDFSDGSIRFVCSWATTPEMVDELAETLARIV
jgi:threonine aldolase